MRDQKAWYKPITEEIRHIWANQPMPMRIGVFCQVELGLRLLERMDPSAAPKDVWPLLGGYPFARARGLAVSETDEEMVNAARHLLWPLRRRHAWVQALENYQEIEERLRGYRTVTGNAPAHWIEPAIGAQRLDVYDSALSERPDFARKRISLAKPGQQYRFLDRQTYTSVTFPTELPPVPFPGHPIERAPDTPDETLEIPLAELAETAEWMEEREHEAELDSGHWADRLSELRLDERTADGNGFTSTHVLRLDRLLHMVGMVGAGKSTLMVLVAVWAARQGRRTTLVVGDVAEQLRLTTLLCRLFDPYWEGLAPVAAPVLGNTTRENHVQRLHRRLAAQGHGSLLTHHEETGFGQLSTVCVVDALRGAETRTPLRYVDAPCTSLYEVKVPERTETDGLPGRYPGGHPDEDSQSTPRAANHRRDTGPSHGCPLWTRCPRHVGARDLVEALVWVANPASLLHATVPAHLNEERLRYLELACLRSDIVIVDEADRVQMQLDAAFAPSATLVTRGPESWLDRLHTHNISELSSQGRLPLSQQNVERWASSLEVVSTATNRLYAMLISDEDLLSWANIDYFNAWTLQEKLLNEWFPPAERATGHDDGPVDESALYDVGEGDLDGEDESTAPASRITHRQRVTDAFDSFRDDPLGDRGPHSPLSRLLVGLAAELLHTLNEKDTLKRVREGLASLLEGTPAAEDAVAVARSRESVDVSDVPGSGPWLDRTARRLAFVLRIAVLHHRLDRLTWLWPQVEAALHLDVTDNELSRRPPLDYAPLVPEAPMGNILGFQYLPEETGPDNDAEGRRSGVLRFFRCAGVGRSLLLSLPDLGRRTRTGGGPHVLLMSGTSWAGTSTRANVLAPVGAVLKPSSTSLEAVGRTVFRTCFLYEDGRPLHLSGQSPRLRPAALRSMVRRLAGPSSGGLLSPLEDELNQIRDINRSRALLLVGSYKEAAIAAEYMNEMERWRGSVRVLVADADDVGAESPLVGEGQHARGTARIPFIRRGDLAGFALDGDAEVLVAPLMAIERGHNILNGEGRAAFGTAFFLARPHPRPDDLQLAVQSINDWATRIVRGLPDRNGTTFEKLVTEAGDLDAAGLAFRHSARREWGRLLARPYIHSRLKADEKASFAWDQLVTIWQVIGRLVRGGVPARVVFVDARFAPRYAKRTAPGSDTREQALNEGPRDGLLADLRTVLSPYFVPAAGPDTFDDPAAPELVRMLYKPLYDALCHISGQARP